MATNRIHDEFVEDVPVSPVFVHIATAIGMPAVLFGRVAEKVYKRVAGLKKGLTQRLTSERA